MRRSIRKITTTVAAATMLAAAASARADNLLYSFETLWNSGTPAGPNGIPPAVPPAPDPNGTRPDDFHNNGGGTITQDTIGATDQTHSMLFSQGIGDTFTGAETENIVPHLNDPNSIITMDVTVPSSGNFTGNFARMGISEFGTQQGDPTVYQVQSLPANEANIALTPGTHRIGIPLIAIYNPLTFDLNAPFSDIFDPNASPHLTPGDWELYINKSSDSPLNIYIDNVRSALLIPGDDNFDGIVNALDFNILATNFGGSGKSLETGDFNGDGHVDSSDFMILARAFQPDEFIPAGSRNCCAGAGFVGDGVRSYGSIARQRTILAPATKRLLVVIGATTRVVAFWPFYCCVISPRGDNGRRVGA